MLELLQLYFWTLVAGALAAPVLALLGIQLATRDRSMQTLCVGQGALVGVLLGLGLLHQWENTLIGSLGPFFTAVLLSALTFFVTDVLVAKRMASKNTLFTFIFALLLALGNLISAVFAALESHMAQIYFGDLATLSVLNSKIVIGASIVSLLILVIGFRSISNRSFELAIYGGTADNQRSDRSLILFKLLTLTVLCFSVQFVGFLYTVALLFLPTAILSFLRTKQLKFHAVACAVTASLSVLIGFSLSLKFTRLPTVPTIVVVLFGLGLCLMAIEALVTLLTKPASQERYDVIGQVAVEQ